MLETCERGIERATKLYALTNSHYWLESAKKWIALKSRI